jgi:hypothetical protein
MSSKIEEATIKMRRDTAANWASVNPIPLEGEFCLETDTVNIKAGDGLQNYKDQLDHKEILANREIKVNRVI